MTKILMFVLTATVMFGLSATASWMLRPAAPAETAPQEPDTAPGSLKANASSRAGESNQTLSSSSSADSSTGKQHEPLRVAVRPPYTPGSEEVVQLAGELRDRLAAIRRREQELEKRRTQVQLIYKDIRGERNTIDDLRKQIDGQLEIVRDELTKLEQRHNKIQQEQQQLQSSVIEIDGIQRQNVKKLAEVYSKMDGESAAGILSKMAESGDVETVVQLLGLMPERTAAKILAALGEAGGAENLAVRLTERLKNLKQPKKAAKKK